MCAVVPGEPGSPTALPAACFAGVHMPEPFNDFVCTGLQCGSRKGEGGAGPAQGTSHSLAGEAKAAPAQPPVAVAARSWPSPLGRRKGRRAQAGGPQLAEGPLHRTGQLVVRGRWRQGTEWEVLRAPAAARSWLGLPAGGSRRSTVTGGAIPPLALPAGGKHRLAIVGRPCSPSPRAGRAGTERKALCGLCFLLAGHACVGQEGWVGGAGRVAASGQAAQHASATVFRRKACRKALELGKTQKQVAVSADPLASLPYHLRKRIPILVRYIGVIPTRSPPPYRALSL